MPSGNRIVSWDLTLPEGFFHIEFEHGTASGKRVIRVNGHEQFRKDWMFRLVGSEHFKLGQHQLAVEVDPDGSFGFTYELFVDGFRYEEFKQQSKRKYVKWNVTLHENVTQVVLERETEDIWVNGTKLTDFSSYFTEDGNEIKFVLWNTTATIISRFSGNKKQQMIYDLVVEGGTVNVLEKL